MGHRHHTPYTPNPQQHAAEQAETAGKVDLRAVVLVAMAGVIFLLVVAFAAYGMLYQDEKILAEVFSLVKWGAGIVAVWAGGEKVARLLGKVQE
jgi:hypothetical protein